MSCNIAIDVFNRISPVCTKCVENDECYTDKNDAGTRCWFIDTDACQRKIIIKNNINAKKLLECPIKKWAINGSDIKVNI